MTKHTNDQLAQLRPGEVLDIHDGIGLSVACVRGSVWITQANDVRDIVIDAPQSFVLDRPGLAVVSAPAEAAVVMIGATARHALDSASERSAA